MNEKLLIACCIDPSFSPSSAASLCALGRHLSSDGDGEVVALGVDGSTALSKADALLGADRLVAMPLGCDAPSAVHDFLGDDDAVLLCPDTPWGRAVAAAIAVRRGWPLFPGCLDGHREKDADMALCRPSSLEGKLLRILCRAPMVVTVEPDAVAPLDEGSPPAAMEPFFPSMPLADPAVRSLGIDSEAPLPTAWERAPVIVAGGRGLGSAEGFSLLRQLARLLGGEVAGSRAAVDAGWIPADRQVGQTGKTVLPKLYIAVGISGAIHHLAGMRRSNIIVAINDRPSAPMVSLAHYAAIGDYREVIPALMALVEKGR